MEMMEVMGIGERELSNLRVPLKQPHIGGSQTKQTDPSVDCHVVHTITCRLYRQSLLRTRLW